MCLFGAVALANALRPPVAVVQGGVLLGIAAYIYIGLRV